MIDFDQEVDERIAANAADNALREAAAAFMLETIKNRYSYNFSWQGRPIIQYPQDIAAIQELVWSVRPDLIIETGIAHGGSLILSASLLALLDLCDSIEAGQMLNPMAPRRKVLGIDIDIRPRNRAAIEVHPMASRIQMIQGSSIAPDIIQQVCDFAAKHSHVMVCLDSNHTYEHVLAELEAYAPLTSRGSYCIVFDTIIDDLPKECFSDRPWGPANNPKTAVHKFLEKHPEFAIDASIQRKLLITVAPDGYLKRVN